MTDSKAALKPCPFCGGDVTAMETHPGRGELYCGECDVVMGGNDAKTPDELMEAWNKRTPDCSTCTERRGHYLDAETIQRQQERIAELERERDEWQLKCFEEAGLHASHLFQRDELIRDMYESLWTVSEAWAHDSYAERIENMGIDLQEDS